MQQAPTDGKARPRIVIVGGGFAGVNVAQQLERMLPRGTADVQLVSADNFFLFQPMLAEVAGGSLEPQHILNPLRELCPRSIVSVGRVEKIDLEQKLIELVHGPHDTLSRISYDYLVIAVGAQTNFSELTGMAQHAFGLKTVGDALYLRNHIIHMLEEADVETDPEKRRELLNFVVVGGGFSGVETMAEINDFVRDAVRHYSRVDRSDVHMLLIHSSGRLLPELGEGLAIHATRRLEQEGVQVRLNALLQACTESEAVLKGDEVIPTRTLVCTIGTAPNRLLSSLPCAKDERGRLPVNAFLEVEGWPGVWALGDCAVVPNGATGSPAPPTAQFAQREAKAVAHNIVVALRGGEKRAFAFSGLGQFVTVGHQYAVANLMGVNVSGFLGWFLWRGIYLFKLPGLARKARVAIDWTLDLLFGRDIVEVQLARDERLGRAHYQPGDIIVHQGDAADLFYVVVDGEVEIIREHQEGGETLIARLGPGEHFGEMAMLRNSSTRSNTVRAATAVNVLTLGRDDFTLLAKKWTGLRESVQEIMRERET